MVIGNGLIAKAFKDFEQNEAYLFFCSGVSNSTCRDVAEFDREKDLLNQNIREHGKKTFIYFSTCSIEDPSLSESMYTRHKLDIEATIASSCKSYYIFRLSNVVGRTPNSFTVLNFLFNAIKGGQKFDLWENSNRNLIDVEDAAAIVRKVLQLKLPANAIINVANAHSYDVVDIVKEIERFLGKEGHYQLVDKGVKFSISVSDIRAIIDELQIDFGDEYLTGLLEKYYTK